jgi:hypothetical protein
MSEDQSGDGQTSLGMGRESPILVDAEEEKMAGLILSVCH